MINNQAYIKKATFVAVVFSLWCQAMGRLTPEDYAREYVAGVDRLYTPLTTAICNKEPHRTNLKSCLLMHQNVQKLKEISGQYLMHSMHYWGEEDQNTVIRETVAMRSAMLRVSNTIGQYRSLNSPNTSARKKRSAMPAYTANQHIPLRRRKRDVWSNPCRESTAQRTTLLHALDAETGQVLELFQNPNQNLYQTFFTKECQHLAHPFFSCKLQYVEFLTVVFSPLYTDPTKVLVRPVKIPSGCAMTINAQSTVSGS